MSQNLKPVVREIQEEYKRYEKRSSELANQFQKLDRNLSEKFRKAGQQASEVVITIEKSFEK